MKEKRKQIEAFFDKHDWLCSESEIKIALAVFGYSMIATLLIYAFLFAIGFVLAILGAL